MMKKSMMVIAGLLTTLSFFALPQLSGESCGSTSGGRTIDVVIQVSPNTIVKSSIGGRLTVHTDIKYSLVDTSTIQLNGQLSPKGTKTDARGNLVAYFNLNDVKAITFPPYAVIEFTGQTVNGDDFYGSDKVRVTN